MQTPSAEAVRDVWTLSLVVFVVVLVVVAVLLTLILRAAHDIKRGVAIIWNVGQRIANNTPSSSPCCPGPTTPPCRSSARPSG